MMSKRLAPVAFTGALALSVSAGFVRPGSCCGSGHGSSGSHAGASHRETAPASGGSAVFHSGSTATTEANAFEVVLLPDGVRIYRYTMQRNPRPIDDAYGRIEMSITDGPKIKTELQRRVLMEGDEAVWFCPMHASVIRESAGTCPICGMDLSPQDFLFAPVDLAAHAGSESDGGAIAVKVDLKGLGEPEERAEFVVRGLAMAESSASAARPERSEATSSGSGHVH